MARPKDQALQERLIHAATRVFSERGFAGASMDDIGQEAGVTKGGAGNPEKG